MSEDSDSRARATQHPKLEAVVDRVDYISELMADGIYTPDTSRKLRLELAEAWGVAKSTIYGYAAEAWRTRIDAVRERRAEVANAAIDALLETARAEVVMPGDRAAKVAASTKLLEFAGVEKPDEDKVSKQKVEHSGALEVTDAHTSLLGKLARLAERESAGKDRSGS